MGVSVFQIQRDLILSKIQEITGGEWMVLVVDDASKKIIDNAVKEDDILNNNIANIERLEDKRDQNPGMGAIYLLSPQEHVVETLVADLQKQRYQHAHLLWTDTLEPQMRKRIASSQGRQHIVGEQEISIDYCPRESHLVIFRDPWSFPVLYHPDCNSLVKEHMGILARKITGVCVSLGEYPKVRFYQPKDALHDAQVLSYHLANITQQSLDHYAQRHHDFPPPSSRPQSVLLITDRSMDLMAPLVHEFTYQAMAHDLLPVKDAEKVTYHVKINNGQEEQDMELQEKDDTWVENRHRHMKDTIDTLMTKFQKFVNETPGAMNDGSPANLNMIKDMLANMPKFQQLKDAYTLHLAMSEDCMNYFQAHKLPELQSVEQSLATGFDENFRKPKNILQEVVRLLDDDAITPGDRLRLIITWLIYRYGVIEEDIKRLLAHAQLDQDNCETIMNLKHLGARVTGAIKDLKTAPAPLFPVDTTQQLDEEYGLIRYHPNVKHMLENLCQGTLDPEIFPYTRPPTDPNEDPAAVQNSLRAAKPNWARGGAGSMRRQDNRQRIIVFMAGGATYSESRACYEVSDKYNRDVFLATSHMVPPKMFTRQVRDLSVARKRLDLPMDRPKPKPAAWVFEPDRPPMPPPGVYPQGGPVAPPPPPKTGPMGGLPPGGPRAPLGKGLPARPGQKAPPMQAMSSMSLGNASPRPAPMSAPMNGGGGASQHSPTPSSDSNKLEKDKKKKRHFFGIK